jgi:hypothetical protein
VTGILCVFAGMGSSTLDTETINVGTFSSGSFPDFTVIRGYAQSIMGTITDGFFAPAGGATITNLYYEVIPNEVMVFALSGTYTNDGWTTMTVGTTGFARSAASFSASGGTTQWVWSGISTDPFSADGTDTVVVFE